MKEKCQTRNTLKYATPKLMIYMEFMLKFFFFSISNIQRAKFYIELFKNAHLLDQSIGGSSRNDIEN